MILIGQYDSPFVRRVGIALRHCGVPFEHRPWSVWGNADQIAEYKRINRGLDASIHLYSVPGNHDQTNDPTPATVTSVLEPAASNLLSTVTGTTAEYTDGVDVPLANAIPVTVAHARPAPTPAIATRRHPHRPEPARTER